MSFSSSVVCSKLLRSVTTSLQLGDNTDVVCGSTYVRATFLLHMILSIFPYLFYPVPALLTSCNNSSGVMYYNSTWLPARWRFLPADAFSRTPALLPLSIHPPTHSPTYLPIHPSTYLPTYLLLTGHITIPPSPPLDNHTRPPHSPSSPDSDVI